MKLRIFTDGGSRGNPGPAGYGYVIYSSAGKVLEKCGNYLGLATNNQAEYAGLEQALTWAAGHYPEASLEIYLDSLLIVNQIKGLYRVKNQQLLPSYLRIKKLLAQFTSYTIAHVPREQNSVADALANQGMDQGQPS